MRIFLRFLILVAALLPFAAIANDDWQVERTTSQVLYTTDQKTWKDLRAGEVVPNRAWISTGPRGRAQLVRGVESIGFQPNTLAAITTKPAGLFTRRKTEIVQQVGALDLEIEKRSQPHTTVQTPYLAAVVKGTIFHVTVGKTRANVAVDRGLVQVTSFASGQQANVGPRQSATVDRSSGMHVAGALSRPNITAVAPSVAVIPALGMTTLSGQATDTTGDKGRSAEARSEDGASNGKSKGNSGSMNSNGKGGGNGNGGGGNGNSGNGGGNGNSGNGGGNGNSGNGGGNGNSGNGGGNGNSGGNGKGNNK